MKNETKQQTYIGGQAVIEGVMMRGKRMWAMAVRKPDNEIEMVTKFFTPISEKFPVLKWPIIRGVVSFVDSLVMGLTITSKSAEIAMPEDEEEKAKDAEKKESMMMKILMPITIVISLALAVLLFMFVPVRISHLLLPVLGSNTWALGIFEGIIKIIILVGYMFLISLMKDIQRVFAYHGAEHKTINCFESGEELTVENVMKHTRLHKRCGTSFLLLVMIISIVVFMLVWTPIVWQRVVLKIVLLPVIAGLSYETIRWAGRSSSPLVGIVSAPGLWLQKISTKEPDGPQIETAIAAMNEVLKNEVLKNEN